MLFFTDIVSTESIFRSKFYSKENCMDPHFRTLCIPIIFLKNELDILEKSRKRLLSKLKVKNPEVGTQLLEEIYSLDSVRNHYNIKTDTEFAEINCILRQIKKDFNKVDEHNFPPFRHTTLRLGGKICSLKKEKEQKLRKLQSDLMDLENNLQYKLNRASIYEDKSYHQQEMNRNPKENLSKHDLAEINYGGWREEDHMLFKKLYKMYGPATAIKITSSILCEMTECEVLQHAEWYQKFNQLKQEEQHYMKCFQNDLQKQPITHKCISRKMRSKSCPPVARKLSKFKKPQCGCKCKYKKPEADSSELLQITLKIDDMIRQFRRDENELG